MESMLNSVLRYFGYYQEPRPLTELLISNVTMHNMKEEAKDAAAGAGVEKENSEHGDMQVASLKMVSSSCK